MASSWLSHLRFPPRICSSKHYRSSMSVSPIMVSTFIGSPPPTWKISSSGSRRRHHPFPPVRDWCWDTHDDRVKHGHVTSPKWGLSHVSSVSKGYHHTRSTPWRSLYSIYHQLATVPRFLKLSSSRWTLDKSSPRVPRRTCRWWWWHPQTAAPSWTLRRISCIVVPILPAIPPMEARRTWRRRRPSPNRVAESWRTRRKRWVAGSEVVRPPAVWGRCFPTWANRRAWAVPWEMPVVRWTTWWWCAACKRALGRCLTSSYTVADVAKLPTPISRCRRRGPNTAVIWRRVTCVVSARSSRRWCERLLVTAYAPFMRWRQQRRRPWAVASLWGASSVVEDRWWQQTACRWWWAALAVVTQSFDSILIRRLAFIAWTLVFRVLLCVSWGSRGRTRLPRSPPTPCGSMAPFGSSSSSENPRRPSPFLHRWKGRLRTRARIPQSPWSEVVMPIIRVTPKRRNSARGPISPTWAIDSGDERPCSRNERGSATTPSSWACSGSSSWSSRTNCHRPTSIPR